ncbi:carcinoembryonic antigen-related cell adhesion molecule 21-like [Xenopus laevis]|uniref:Carcinoembryonic antigen-related cell adhesion molecule 21-like n=1 Tax=Xenopus laevis TaxID=8355 RepID=A0A8J1LA41_XENLA|nr:carcinoembryonic antigen-related cell adhesion molecule 21-like [Xenopus laevis]
MKTYLLSALFSVWINLINGISIQLMPEYPVDNQPVTLSVSGVIGIIESFSWYKSSTVVNSSLILTYNSSSYTETQGPQYFSRASGLPDGSLSISTIYTTDQTYYTVQVEADSLTVDTIYLRVYVPVTKPEITASLWPEELEYNLTCRENNAEKILWNRIDGRFPSGVIFSNNNRTMTIPKFIKSDAGQYQCEVENTISKNISDLYMLSQYCVCTDPPADNTVGILAGIICGTIAGIALIASVTFLLYTKYIHPVKQANTGQFNDKQDPSATYDTITGRGEGMQHRQQHQQDHTYCDLKI